MRRSLLALFTLSLFALAAPALVTHAAAGTAQTPIIPQYCFKQEECPASKGFATLSQDCNAFDDYKYACIAKPPHVPLSISIGGRTAIDGIQDYVATLYKFLISIAGVLSGVMITFGGFQWLTAAGDGGKIKKAQERIWHALIGLVLVLGSYTILNTINPALLHLQLAPIKLIRPDALIPGSPYDSCNTDSDCANFVLRTAECGIVVTDQTPVQIKRTCEATTPPPSPEFRGKCKIAENNLCKLSSYTCNTTVGTLTFGLLGDIKSGGADMSGFCQKATSCQFHTKFPMSGGLTGPNWLEIFVCKKTTLGSPCISNNDCGTLICKTETSSDGIPSGKCIAIAGGVKAVGEACSVDEECPTIEGKKSRCNQGTSKCGQPGGDPIGTDCRAPAECNSGACVGQKCQATDRTAQGQGGIREGGLCENNSQCDTRSGLTCSCTQWNSLGDCTGDKKCYGVGGEYYRCSSQNDCGRGFTCQSNGFTAIKMCRSQGS